MKVRQKSSAYFNNLLRPDWFVGFFIVTMCIFLIGGELTVALAQEGPDLVQESNIVEDAGVGIFSVLLTLPYGPTKIAYATLGGVVGVGAWLVSGGNVDVANTVWDASFYGDYVITPEHLRGEKPLRFIGKAPIEDDSFIQ